MNKRVMRHVVVRGRVQGVFFRGFVQQAALRAGVEGWVRNRRDDSVEAVFAGDATAVAAMVVACRRGPPAARVDTLDERDATAAEFALRHSDECFSVLPTA